jgi:hypothetical protein
MALLKSFISLSAESGSRENDNAGVIDFIEVRTIHPLECQHLQSVLKDPEQQTEDPDKHEYANVAMETFNRDTVGLGCRPKECFKRVMSISISTGIWKNSGQGVQLLRSSGS